MVYLVAMTTSTEREVLFVFAVPLRVQRVTAFFFVGVFVLMALYVPFTMGVHRFVNMLPSEPFIWALMALLAAPVAIFLKMAYPSPRSLAKLEARRDSIRFAPTWFANRVVGEPILEVSISPHAKEIVLSRDLRDRLPSTWSVSVLSTGEPERSFKTTRLNLTTAEQGNVLVEGIGAATGLPVRLITRQQTGDGTVEEIPWAPPASRGKSMGVGLAIGVMPYIGGAVVGYVFPRASIVVAVGFALWLFDLLAISAFARRSQPRTKNLGVHLIARFFMFWTGYGLAFVTVAYVLRDH
jgi:hypothetical protein